MDIMTGLTAISETLKITKELRSIDNKVDVAELKLRLSDLVDSLLNAKEALQDAKEQERALEFKIEELTQLLDQRGKFEDENGALYELDDNGKRVGVPYCNQCYVKEGKFFRLKVNRGGGGFQFECHNCTSGYGIYSEVP